MLYDPKWEQKTQPATFTKEGLIAWLETFHPDTKYDFCKKSTCLIARYLQARGEARYELYSTEISDRFGDEVLRVLSLDCTFGGVLEGLRAIDA